MSESDHPMYVLYGKDSDEQLMKALEWKRHVERMVINRNIHCQSAWYLDKEILCLETLLGQRIKQQAINEASKEYNNKDEDDEEIIAVQMKTEEDLEDHGDRDRNKDDGDEDNHPQPLHLPTQPILDPLSQSLPPSHQIINNNSITTLPPDSLAPIPLPMSLNISVQPPPSPTPDPTLSRRCTPTPTPKAEYTTHTLVLDVRGWTSLGGG